MCSEVACLPTLPIHDFVALPLGLSDVGHCPFALRGRVVSRATNLWLYCYARFASPESSGALQMNSRPRFKGVRWFIYV